MTKIIAGVKKITNNNAAPPRLSDYLLASSHGRCVSKKFFLFLCVLCVLCGSIYAQTAQEIETLLNTQAITYAQAARFALQASDKLTTRSQTEAFQYAQNQGWLPQNVQADTHARLDGISFLLMNCFDLNGGIFYSLTSSSHHAYRELQHKNIIFGRTYPNQAVSGDLFLYMVNRLLDDRERVNARTAAAAARRQEREAAQRREALAAEITAVLEEQSVSDTTVQATSEGVQITLSNIQFVADSARLTPQEIQKIREIANILRNIPGIKLQITGHTALAGDEAGRYRISLERAQAVATQLVTFGACRASDIAVVGMGADQPIADNSTAEGMAANRRVEIMILE